MREPGFQSPLSVQDLAAETVRLLRDNAVHVLGAAGVLTLIGSLIDSGVGGPGLNLVLSVLTVFLQYLAIVASLDRLGLRMHSDARFAAFFGLSLLTGIAVLAGMVLLLIPGIVLLARWSASGPALIAANQSITEAIGDSWHRTRGRFWPILAALILFYAPPLAGAIFAWWIDPQGMAAIVAANLCLNAALIAGWHLAVALYVLTEDRASVAEVFT